MKKCIFLAAFFLLSLSFSAVAQTVDANKENEAVRKVVEAYLYATDADVRRQAFYGDAKIISLDAARGKVVESPVSKPHKKKPGETVGESVQKIVSIDVTKDGALVKVETEFPADAKPSIVPQKHFQYLSLLKVNGDWKIVQILMPPLEFSAAGK